MRDADSEPAEASCPAERRALATRESAVRDACAADVARLDCVPPVPFPVATPAPDALRDMLSDMLASCGSEGPKGLVLSCDSYPCWLAVPQASFEQVTSCARFEETKRWATENLPEGVGGAPNGADWVALPLGRFGGTLLERPVRQRVTTSLRALAMGWSARDGSDEPLVSAIEPTCAEVQTRRRALDGPDACRALTESWGCADQVPTTRVEPADVQAYLQEAYAVWDAAVDRCPALTQAGAMLDCESVPCLVRFFPTKGQPWDETVCHDPALTYEFHASSSQVGDYVIAPLVTGGVLQLPGVLDRWLDESTYRKWALGQREDPAAE